MRQNAALDIAVFQDFDAVHACGSKRATDRRRSRNPGLGLVPHVIELLFLGLFERRPALIGVTAPCRACPPSPLNFEVRCIASMIQVPRPNGLSLRTAPLRRSSNE
jgi:hypothetical protein